MNLSENDINIRWLSKNIVLAINDKLCAEYSGNSNVNLEILDAVMNYPQNHTNLDNPDFASIAAQYAFAFTFKKPFASHNSRVALVATEVFLNVNGYRLVSSSPFCVVMIKNLEDGEISETEFTLWLKRQMKACD